MEQLPTLTAKQQRFVEEYLVDFNGTQAAIRAGYSHATATAIGSENLRKPDVAAAVLARREEMSQQALIASMHVQERAIRSVERLERIAEIDPDSATDRRLQAALQANVKLLEGSGVLKTGTQIVIDNRRIDLRAMELWQQGGAEAWQQRHRSAIPDQVGPTVDDNPPPTVP